MTVLPTPAPRNDDDLVGKIAVVTGGASGIGRAVVEQLLARRARVVLGDVTVPAGVTQSSGPVTMVRTDVRSAADIEHLMDVAAGLGPIGILVNSAGVTVREAIDDMTESSWARLIDVNLRGTAFAIKAAVARMSSDRGGAIVNIASTAGFRTMSPLNTSYVASKGGVIALTRSLVYELSPRGIRINAVAPGMVNTPIVADRGQDWRGPRVERIPLGRIAEASDIASVVLFLASDAASYVTGHVLVADGGASAVSFTPNSA